ncbi:hypothetical protein [Arthrobacter sp. GAS37]|uniref:hypothetical protein n=1 Tax=Arthrobacter sp. GAS37 TaxID=3156261 RepID=UPI00384BE679
MKKALIKAWLLEYLKAKGFPARADEKIGTARADVATEVNGWKIAIRLELDRIPAGEVRSVTAEFGKAGYGSLWLTHDLSWFGQEPAVGIELSEDKDKGLAQRLRVGYGVYRLSENEVRRDSLPLTLFLDRYFSLQLRHGHLTTSKKIWANHQDWDIYLHANLQALSDMKSHLKTARLQRDQERQQRMEAQSATDAATRQAKKHQTDLAEMRNLRDGLQRESSRRQAWISSLAARREENALARFALRKMPVGPVDEDVVPGDGRSVPGRAKGTAAAIFIAWALAIAAAVFWISGTWSWWLGLLGGAVVLAGPASWWLQRTCWFQEAPAGDVCQKKRDGLLSRCKTRHHTVTRYSAAALSGAVIAAASITWLAAAGISQLTQWVSRFMG